MMTNSPRSTHASINLMRVCRARLKARNPPIKTHSAPISGWIKWRAAFSSSKPDRPAERAASHACTQCGERFEIWKPGGSLSHQAFLMRDRLIHMTKQPIIRAVLGSLVLAFASLGMAHAEDEAAQPAAAVDQLPSGQDVSDTVV